MSRGYPSRAREIVAALHAEGWRFTGAVASGHLKFVHPCGATVTTSSTPSNQHAVRRAVAQARRLLKAHATPTSAA